VLGGSLFFKERTSGYGQVSGRHPVSEEIKEPGFTPNHGSLLNKKPKNRSKNLH